MKLEVNDIMYVAYFFSSDLFSNFIKILPQFYVYLKKTEISYKQQKYCKNAKLLCVFYAPQYNDIILKCMHMSTAQSQVKPSFYRIYHVWISVENLFLCTAT